MNTENQPELQKELYARIQNYLGNGGFFNPEMMEHDKVRDLLIDVRDFFDGRPSHAHSVVPRDSSDATGAQPEKENIIKAIEGLLAHAGIADQSPEDIDAEDHASESFARKVLRDLRAQTLEENEA